jgi:hypothetical protein
MHLDFFNKRVQAFAADNSSHRIETKDDWQTGEVIIYAETLTKVPVDEWGAIIGDVVHNLRSALDHLVWQLTLANGNTPPPNPVPRDSCWRKIGFPIWLKPYPADHRGNLIPWASARKEPKSLWGVRPSLRADFEALQPFKHGQNAAKEPLAILDELWNIDKHRHLHLPHFLVSLRDVRSTPPLDFAVMPEIKLRVIEKHAPRPFKGRTEVGRVEQVGKHRSPILNMYVDSYIAYDVAFEQGPPAYGDGVVQTLERLHDTVTAILVQF